MTKEWYQIIQKTDFHFNLKVSKKAEIFSEDYFKKLYKKEEKAWLQLFEEESKYKLEDIYPEEFQVEEDDELIFGTPEFEKAKKEYLEMRERERLIWENPSPFDPEKEKKFFKQSFRSNLKDLKEGVPDVILNKIADIRVLALNWASTDIKKELTAYCKANEKAMELVIKEYWKEYRKNFKKAVPDFYENFNIHDCRIISYRKVRKDIILSLDNIGSISTINKLILKNCSVIKQDESLRGAWWLYDEIYKTNDGYELHVLLFKNDLIDFIVTVSDIECK